MNNETYDISDLVELESMVEALPAVRTPSTPVSVRAPTRTAKPQEDALARELLALAPAHDALIRQYMGGAGVTSVMASPY